MKIKLILSFLLIINLYACQGQIITIDTDAIIIYGDSNLQNYSYNNYDLSPFMYNDFTMPFNIGEEYLVLYQKSNRGLSVLEEHQIIDTISIMEPCRGDIYITIPVFDDDSYHTTCITEMIFFKGFQTYNEDIRKTLSTNNSDGFEENKRYEMFYYSWMLDGKNYSYTDKILKKKNLNEISYSDGLVKQILIKRFSKDCTLKHFRVHSIIDLDGDGLEDLIIRAYHDHEPVISYLLFLSSEAEEGELLKHVATKTITIRDKNKGSEDIYNYFEYLTE